MRIPLITVVFSVSTLIYAQAGPPQPAFEVVSVRPSAREAGPDYNNQITYSTGGFTGRNVTLKRLIAEAWRCQMNQVVGPAWLDRNEYDVEAREPAGARPEQVSLMLRTLLADRFHLKEHSETRQMRVYELTVAPGGPKIRPVEPGSASPAGGGFHFRGDMREFADLLAVQFSIPAADRPDTPVRAGGTMIPVLNETRLEGVYEFNVDGRPEVGTDAFTGWKRVLESQLGLRIESQNAGVAVVVVDDAAKVPTPN